MWPRLEGLLVLLLLRCQLYLWASLFFFFFFCVPSYISGLHYSSSSASAFPAISLGFTILFLLLLRSQLYLWASLFFFFVFCVPSYIWASLFFFFFFCVPSYISSLHYSPFSSSAFQAISLGFTILLFLLLLRSKLYLWASLFFFFFFCVPSYTSGLHYSFSSSSSSAFPALSLGFTILFLLLRSQLYLCGSLFFFFFFFFFCVPSYISGFHYSFSSSSAFPVISLGFTILLLLRSQLYVWASPFFFFFFFFFFCVPSYMCGLHHSYSSSAFPAICVGFTILLLLLLRSQLYVWASSFFLFFFFFLFFCFPSYMCGLHHSSFSSTFQAISFLSM